MPGELLELARAGKYTEFEARCLGLLEKGQLGLAQLAAPFEALEAAGLAERLGMLSQMVFDQVAPTTDPQTALRLARVALVGSPKSEDLRRLTSDLYRQIYGQAPGFAAILSASGLEGGRPVRMALKLLDLCLGLKPGDTVISRMDGRVFELAEIDREHGLFTLRREGRVTTIPAPDVARDYDRIAADDFRVLRQLRPERLASLIQDSPVAVVIGLIHAHGGHIDADLLKHELVPKHIPASDWSSWWSRARQELKRSPHVLIEGRSPVLLSYSAEGQTLEDETWETLIGQKDPADWLVTIEGYLREKTALREKPDQPLLARFEDHLRRFIEATRPRRPIDALVAALVLGHLGEKGVPLAEDPALVAKDILANADDPGRLLTQIHVDVLRERAFELLRAARPQDWAKYALAWLPDAPASLLDTLVEGATAAGKSEEVQAFVEAGLSDAPSHPELIYWLWKGSRQTAGLKLPSDLEFFQMLLDTLSAVGRTVAADPKVVKAFRGRMKSAFGLRDYARVRKCLESTSEAAAIIIRRQIDRLEGLGENAPAKMLEILREIHPELWIVRPKQVAPWADPETIWTTAAGMAKRTAERDDLVNVKMRDNAKRIGEAASHGDLSENSEYKFALEERDLLRARLAKINEDLSRARVLEPHDVPDDRVGIGVQVTLRGVADGQERVMTFLGPFDTDVERSIYSYQAPVAQKLMGRQLGERVTLALDGPDSEFEIAALAGVISRYAPESAPK